VARHVYLFRLREQVLHKCLRCALIDRRLLRQSIRASLVVGTLLVALNQGDLIARGSFDWAHSYPKVVLTYLVPFLVSTYGALANARLPVTAGEVNTP